MSELLSRTREICQMFEIKPARSKGQNFLINEKIYDDIVKAAGVGKGDTVLEVGPGLGFMTAKLAQAAKRVIAVELDDKLASYLQMAVDAQDLENVEIVNQDILKLNLTDHLLPGEPFKVVANLPYNITSIFLRSFLSASRQPETMTLMLQKEVAERMSAMPPDMSLLAVSVQYYSEPKIIREVKAGNFWPEPEVDSAIITLNIRGRVRDEGSQQFEKTFFRLVRSGFSAKRKMLKNNLAAGLRLKSSEVEKEIIKLGLDPKVRAEELAIENWKKLVAALSSFVV